MEEEVFTMYTDIPYPVLFMPKKCIALEISNGVTDLIMNVNMTSGTTEGNEKCLYSGRCDIKLIDDYDTRCIRILSKPAPNTNNINQIQVVEENIQTNSFSSYSQSCVWIDPARSPYVCCNHDTGSQQNYSMYHDAQCNHITMDHHNTYITKNDYNNLESVCYSPPEEFDQRKLGIIQASDINPPSSLSDLICNTYYENDEFGCGVFLSTMTEEILNEQEARDKEETRYIGLESENVALTQLMSSDLQSMSKQQKMIRFLDQDSDSGQTIQKNAIDEDLLLDPCVTGEVQQEVVVDHSRPKAKKNRRHVSDQPAELKQVIVGKHTDKGLKFTCTECGNSFKTPDKLKLHYDRHGDPDLECNRCRKVFSSKYTLRRHRKIHYRKHLCDHCRKSFLHQAELTAHLLKCHKKYAGCSITHDNSESLLEHDKKQDTDIDHMRAVPRDCDNSSIEPTAPFPSPSDTPFTAGAQRPSRKEIREANSVIGKVIMNRVFLLDAKQARKIRTYKKVCDICSKEFTRVGDLKRHLIEHLIKSTLAKNPVNQNGTLVMRCEICHMETFFKIEQYKAHLREHAKLTLYECKICNKSFSDSSNFSKHKKVHGSRCFQCDICQRKFNSKRMITRHMEYHNNNAPIPCPFCDKSFHFVSMLNKHIKCVHTAFTPKARCKFCHQYFETLREKWDHEWAVHNARKLIVDCLMCAAKFRKYSDLKRHCKQVHSVNIPLAKVLLKENDIE